MIQPHSSGASSPVFSRNSSSGLINSTGSMPTGVEWYSSHNSSLACSPSTLSEISSEMINSPLGHYYQPASPSYEIYNSGGTSSQSSQSNVPMQMTMSMPLQQQQAPMQMVQQTMQVPGSPFGFMAATTPANNNINNGGGIMQGGYPGSPSASGGYYNPGYVAKSVKLSLTYNGQTIQMRTSSFSTFRRVLQELPASLNWNLDLSRVSLFDGDECLRFLDDSVGEENVAISIRS